MLNEQKAMINEALTLSRLYWGYSQRNTVKALGMPQTMASEIERGTKSATLGTLDRYSEALGVKKSQLMFYAEEIEGGGNCETGSFD